MSSPETIFYTIEWSHLQIAFVLFINLFNSPYFIIAIYNDDLA